MRFSISLFVLLTTHAVARIADTWPMSDSELWDSSSIIAIVDIVGGSYVAQSRKYSLLSDVRLQIKGEPQTELSFVAIPIGETTPDRLGGTYLLSLEQGVDGKLRTLESNNSIVELNKLPNEYDHPDYFEVWKTLGLNPKHILRFGKVDWIPQSCWDKEGLKNFLCEREAATLAFMAGKYGQLANAMELM